MREIKKRWNGKGRKDRKREKNEIKRRISKEDNMKMDEDEPKGREGVII